MNCTTVLCLSPIYTSNSLNLSSLSTSDIGGYSHPLSSRIFGISPMIFRTTQWWNPHRVCAMQGVTTQFSNHKSIVACTTVT